MTIKNEYEVPLKTLKSWEDAYTKALIRAIGYGFELSVGQYGAAVGLNEDEVRELGDWMRERGFEV